MGSRAGHPSPLRRSCGDESPVPVTPRTDRTVRYANLRRCCKGRPVWRCTFDDARQAVDDDCTQRPVRIREHR
jgi:hypothetical protein